MSGSIGVHCGACGADLGDQFEPGDGLAMFRAHVPACPSSGMKPTHSDPHCAEHAKWRGSCGDIGCECSCHEPKDEE